MPFENCQHQETSSETLVSQKFVCLCGTHLPVASLSPALDGELVSQQVCFNCLGRGILGELTEGTDVLMKFLREEAVYRLPGKANLDRCLNLTLWGFLFLFNLHTKSTAMFYLGSQAKSLVPCTDCSLFLSYFQRLSALCLSASEAILPSSESNPHSHSMSTHMHSVSEARSLNRKGIFQRRPLLSWKVKR